MDAVERYHPAPEQRALAGAMGDALADLLPLARLHGADPDEAGVWSAFEGLGLFGITLPEDQGGSGLGAVEEALIALELGRRLACPSVLCGIGANHARWRDGRRTAGRITAGYRSGADTIFVAAPDSRCILIRDGDRAFIAPPPANSRPLDNRHWLSSLRGAEGVEESLADFDDDGVLRLRLNDAAALAGMAQLATDMAVEYAKLRSQFGRPIGSFQAVKHHCANMAIAARAAGDLVGFAAVAIDDGRSDAAFQVESALLTASGAAIANAGLNIQIHGGIGFSEEAAPHLVLKRARLLLAICGGQEAANRRLGDLPPLA